MGIFKRMKDVWGQIFNPPPIIDLDKIRHAFMADPITPEEFLKPDKAALEAKTREFMKLGFSYIGDFEYRHYIGWFSETTVLIRIFVDAEMKTIANLTQICPHPEKNKNLACFQSFSNEFSDGTFLETVNVPVDELIDEVEGVVMQNFPPESTISELWDRHRLKFDNILSSKNVRSVSYRNPEEILESEERSYSLFREEIRKRGNFTAEEMMQYSPGVMISVRPTHYRTYKKRQTEKYDLDDDDDDNDDD